MCRYSDQQRERWHHKVVLKPPPLACKLLLARAWGKGSGENTGWYSSSSVFGQVCRSQQMAWQRAPKFVDITLDESKHCGKPSGRARQCIGPRLNRAQNTQQVHLMVAVTPRQVEFLNPLHCSKTDLAQFSMKCRYHAKQTRPDLQMTYADTRLKHGNIDIHTTSTRSPVSQRHCPTTPGP